MDYLPFVRSDRHKGPVAAVVDFVIAGHRLKVRVRVRMTVAGVRLPVCLDEEVLLSVS